MCRYVIHTVGPRGNTKNKKELLGNAYKNSLKIAAQNDIKTIAFPSISTAIFGYKLEEATPVAINAVISYLSEHQTFFEEVRFILYDQKTYDAFNAIALETLKCK